MRGKPAKKRILKPDIRYGSSLISRLINYIVKDGRKSIAERIVYSALDTAQKKLDKDPIEIVERAIENIAPKRELESRRVGGANYQVPIEVRGERRVMLALRWLLEAARKKKGKPMEVKLAIELIDAYNDTGDAVTKKVNVHKMADANKAFAHFAW